MEFDVSIINSHIFSEGAIQMQPSEIQLIPGECKVQQSMPIMFFQVHYSKVRIL
jgi:hypothetical protein